MEHVRVLMTVKELGCWELNVFIIFQVSFLHLQTESRSVGFKMTQQSINQSFHTLTEATLWLRLRLYAVIEHSKFCIKGTTCSAIQICICNLIGDLIDDLIGDLIDELSPSPSEIVYF